MTFAQRMKLVIEYRKWLGTKNATCKYHVADEPDTFLLFLFIKGLLKEISPGCTLLHARENCEEYERQTITLAICRIYAQVANTTKTLKGEINANSN